VFWNWSDSLVFSFNFAQHILLAITKMCKNYDFWSSNFFPDMHWKYPFPAKSKLQIHNCIISYIVLLNRINI
jgi:hypothetical protein